MFLNYWHFSASCSYKKKFLLKQRKEFVGSLVKLDECALGNAFLVTMPSEPTNTGTTCVLMFLRRAMSLLTSWYFWIFFFSLSAMLAFPGTAMSILSITMHSFSFAVYQYYVWSPGLDFTVRLNGKLPQEFYGTSFDNRFWLVLHTISLRHQVHSVSRLTSAQSWQRCHILHSHSK